MDFKKVKDLSFQFSMNMKSLSLLQEFTEQKDMGMEKKLHGTAVPESALSFSLSPPPPYRGHSSFPLQLTKINSEREIYCTPYSLFLWWQNTPLRYLSLKTAKENKR